MKLIKCGSSQTRIAQACDRCRSKKIRCDGIRPCCSQCANVGFECKTSDKLSRRAFPRGYTESLEERVRVLEQETRELKELLDSKDEQLDMLSRIHSFSPYSPPPSAVSHRRSPTSARSESVEIAEDMFLVHEVPSLVGGEDDVPGGFYVGSSSGRSFVGILMPPLSSDFYISHLVFILQSAPARKEEMLTPSTLKTSLGGKYKLLEPTSAAILSSRVSIPRNQQQHSMCNPADNRIVSKLPHDSYPTTSSSLISKSITLFFRYYTGRHF